MSMARKPGKSKAAALGIVYWLSQKNGYAAIAMRDTSANLVNSVIAEVLWAIREFKITGTKYFLGKKEIHFANGNIVYFRGAQTANLAQVALAGFAPSYDPVQWIVWLEEVYQFTAKQYAEIAQAIRGAPKVIWETSNPWLLTN